MSLADRGPYSEGIRFLNTKLSGEEDRYHAHTDLSRLSSMKCPEATTIMQAEREWFRDRMLDTR